ncbi:GNAT family N-acetyltransferase [Usitatibacter palustris]|uniref:N-acetyltransferase domain-containing protein n=1 Tax=Usitatibacter palustris TaxID=2732487 RepID=A0A6M4H710_9PROT|nr:GNAT family N-acetyltransferase [Usitatibacter palustris]QJR14463.1 hypothetical protein DSM104440_01259 [Usitatibacter palustris]
MAELLRALLLEIPELIETERMQLRAVRAGQGAEVHEALVESYPQLATWMPWAKQLQSSEETEAYAREAQAKWLARTTLDFTWYSKDGAVVGKGGLHTIDWAIPKFEIGYWVRTTRARQGFASEGTRALAEFARTHLGARRIEITSDARNLPSRRVAEKCGFTLEGIRLQSRRDNAGDLADSCMYARVF